MRRGTLERAGIESSAVRSVRVSPRVAAARAAMSGFAGLVSTDGATPDRDLLARMAAGLGFRGPDGTQVWSQAGAGFCFTLLRIGPAPQSSEQPCSLDGRTWLVGDVRLDGREDLRHELEQSSESVALHATDEELILRVWRRWGEEGLAKL